MFSAIDKKQGAIIIVTSLLLGAGTFFWVACTSGAVGWTWDEVYYFSSSELQLEWLRAIIPAIKKGTLSHIFSQSTIDSYWLWDTYHNPHPSFYKILSSLSLIVFRNVLGEFVAYRLATAFLAGMLVCFLFLAVEKKHGLLPALYGALSLLFMPLFFGHAHIAATEIPLATFWFCSYWAFRKGLDRMSGSLMLSVFLGCALATKFTAILIPGAFLLWSILYRDRRALRNIAAMTLSPLIAVVLNPGWWHQPFKKIVDFILISTSREMTLPISTFFMNKMYVFSPPWYYSSVMIAITVPVVILLTILLGFVFLVKQKFRNAYDMLFLLN
ncbi:MAG: glycosyltransferase family 39 protein, partial [Pseudomonadota bacterium]